MISLAYVVVALVVWRTLTGHFAWEAHRSATERTTLRPPVEKWVVCAVPAFVLAVAWPLTLLFVIPWPLRRGAEREGEGALVGLVDPRRRLRALEVESDRLEQTVDEDR